MSFTWGNRKIPFVTKNSLIFQGIAIILVVLQLVVYYQGIKNEWYQSLSKPFKLPAIVNVILWLGAYSISIWGMSRLKKKAPLRNLPTSQYFTSLLIVSLIVSFMWLWLFFVSRDIHLAVILQAFNVVYHLWYVYTLYQYNREVALMQVPLLMWMIYIFVISYLFSWANPTYEGLRVPDW